jgi:diaminopimelate epimerase
VALSFDKYHGLGNDFIVLEVPNGDAVDSALARRLCDRHFGVGADGVLLVAPSERADARLVILNADGSRPEMCGNGLRCVAVHLERTTGVRERIRVETDAGILECIPFDRDGRRWVTISLGEARPLGILEVTTPEGAREFRRISVGNPHAVVLGYSPDLATIDRLGPEVSARIIGGANVEFTRVTGPRAIDVVVWERGVGRTLACGTGAGAVVMAAAEAGLVPFDEGIEVTLPGGQLEVRAQRADRHVFLSGPAEHVFGGAVAEN